MTPQEVRLWRELRQLRGHGYHFRRQVPSFGYILDFACLRHGLAIELDGSQHAIGAAPAQDAEREGVLRAGGLRVLRFWNADVNENIGGVVDVILHELESSAPHPAPSGRPSPEGEGAVGKKE